jgi:Zn-dependent protease with chaperone function
MGLTLGAVLPFSRTQEFEADELGVRFMDMAKYDMEGALRFWQASMSKGRGNTAEFMSTHPSDGNRLARLHYVIEQQRLWSMAGRAAL